MSPAAIEKLYRDVVAGAAYRITYRRDGHMVSGELVLLEEHLRPRLRNLRRMGVRLVCVERQTSLVQTW